MPAFVFPGQGAQRARMGRPWFEHPSWEVVVEAGKTSGRDLAYLLFDATNEELTETHNAQLATFTFSLLVLDAVERLGIEPTSVAGHSLGEYTALVATGAIGFEDGVRLVAERGEAMQVAADAEPGIMRIIRGLDADTVDICCRLAGSSVWVANFNSAEDTVIAGEPEIVEMACQFATERGARRIYPIAAGGAFHTPFMQPALPRLDKALSEVAIRDPEIPIIANVDACPHLNASEWPLLLKAQLCSPVRWRQSISRLHRGEGGLHPAEELFIELGPGTSLSTMIRQTIPSAITRSVSCPSDLDGLVDALAGTERAGATNQGGEHLYVSERLVIASCAGIFEPNLEISLKEGTEVEVGTLLGSVSGAEVRSAFAGELMGMIAHKGERVQMGQPLAWLRAE